MERVVVLPEVIGRQRDHADETAEPVVGPARAEEGTVAAVVLDDEKAHQEGRGRHDQEDDLPQAPIEAPEKPGDEKQERQGGDEKLEGPATAVGPGVLGDHLAPAWSMFRFY